MESQQGNGFYVFGMIAGLLLVVYGAIGGEAKVTELIERVFNHTIEYTEPEIITDVNKIVIEMTATPHAAINQSAFLPSPAVPQQKGQSGLSMPVDSEFMRDDRSPALVATDIPKPKLRKITPIAQVPAPTQVPPTQVPPTQVPPTQVPPTQVPPTQVPLAPITPVVEQPALTAITPVPAATLEDIKPDEVVISNSLITGNIEASQSQTVEVTLSGGGYFNGYQTADGSFEFYDVPPGTYKLEVTHSGGTAHCADMTLNGAPLSFNLVIIQGGLCARK